MTEKLTPWTAADYAPNITGSGAEKLADSGVAPLVAVARGYRTITDVKEASAYADRSTQVTGATRVKATLRGLVKDGADILTMPWYSLSAVAESGQAAPISANQYRPSNPKIRAGKPVKYAFLSGEKTTIDAHPATPHKYINGTLSVFITEGIIKADSILTAMLRSNGVSDQDLALPAGQANDQASTGAALTRLLETVPDSKQFLVLGLAGVAGYHSHPEWNSMRLTDRDILVAFDADAATNPAVWKQADQLFTYLAETKKGTPRYVNLSGELVAKAKEHAAMPADAKVGADEFLTRLGSFTDLLNTSQDALPPNPAPAGGHTVGSWRVNPDRPWQMEEFVSEADPLTGGVRTRWMLRGLLGGRVAKTETLRRATALETETGLLDPAENGQMTSSTVTIRVCIQSADGNPEFHNITGPAAILSTSILKWTTTKDVNIPLPVLRHPEWPPEQPDKWLKAIKSNENENEETEAEHTQRWDQMGWVPTASGNPAFIVGRQVLGASVEDEQTVLPGVTDDDLSGAESFGVVDNFRELTLEQWKKQSLDDLRAVVDHFVTSGFFTDKATAAVIFAAMLRPTMPTKIGTTVYFHGAPGSGKSFAAAFVMSGWQRNGGTWTASRLPGSGEDTPGSTEFAMARTPIWVMDDMAPDVSRARSENKESAVTSLTRSQFNHSAKRRLDGNTMRQRKTESSNCLFLVTAENELQTESAAQRYIPVNMRKGVSITNDEGVVDQMLSFCNFQQNPIPARLVAALIRFWSIPSENLGQTWSSRMRRLNVTVRREVGTIQQRMERNFGTSKSDSTRAAEVVSDLTIVFTVLQLFIQFCGADEDDPLWDYLVSLPGGGSFELCAMAAAESSRTISTAPGRKLMEGLRDVLSSGAGHVVNPLRPGKPPVEAEAGDDGAVNADALNAALGWVCRGDGQWFASGEKIGDYAVHPSGEAMVLFNLQPAFSLVKKALPGVLLHGQNAAATWNSVWNEGLTVKSISRPRNQNSLGYTLPGHSLRLPGIPVRLDALLQGDAADRSAEE